MRGPAAFRRTRAGVVLFLVAMFLCFALPAHADATAFHATYQGTFTITFLTGPGLSDELSFHGSGSATPGPGTVDGYSTLRSSPGLDGICNRTVEDVVLLTLPDGALQLHNQARDCLDLLSKPGTVRIVGSGTWTVTGGTGAYAGAQGSGTVQVAAEVEHLIIGGVAGTFDPLVFDGELVLGGGP
ncbi:MAG: hypothetical protein WEB06_12530 [Actinomycetota bacterium]